MNINAKIKRITRKEKWARIRRKNSEISKVCKVERCEKVSIAKDFCRKHYRRWYFYGDPSIVHQILGNLSLKDRLFAHRTIDKNGCWIKISTKPTEYFKFVHLGKHVRASHVSYEIFKGQIPIGKVIDHLCKNPSCFNPDHLEAVTQWENVFRGNGVAVKKAMQTHCKRGHEFIETNIIWALNGNRRCRSCIREYHHKKYLMKKKAA